MLLFDEPFIDGWLGRSRGGPIAPPSRPHLAASASLGFSCHSFLYQAVAPGEYGNLGGYWTGGMDIAYAGFSSLKQRWDANGVDRTGSYSGALIVTEIGDLQTGLADPASPQGIETLQYLYWYALTAQAKGCKLFGIYPPHSPEGLDLDADAMAKVQYWIDWLRARPEITIPVYAIPVPVMVRAMIDRFAPASIYADGLHLRTPVYPAPNQANNALGQMLRMFLTGARVANDPGWSAGMIELVDSAWAILRAHACTGLGGATVIAPYPVTGDPLPNPAPHPDALAPYYGTGPGRIAIHFDSDHASRDGSGNVTALQNRGGAGAVFDATVSGTAIPVVGNALVIAPEGGRALTANAIEMNGVRTMFVLSAPATQANAYVMGGVSGADVAQITYTRNTGGLGKFRVWRNAGGFVDAPVSAAASSGAMLVEVEITASARSVFINGALAVTDAAPWASYMVLAIGGGAHGVNPAVTGNLGDVLGVTLGAGADAAIAAARAYLAARYGIALP